MRTVSWNYASGYIGAGNIDVISINNKLNMISINIVYLRSFEHGRSVQMDIIIECLNCRYFEFLRDEEHVIGPASLLDAYLHDESDLISAYSSHELHTKTDSQVTEDTKYHHLQLIGEIDINILCETVIVKASPMRPEQYYDTNPGCK